MPQETSIYIVDDDQGDRESLCALVSSAGFLARPYASAKQFIEEYDGESAGCVIADYRMEDVDGLALQKQILAKEWGLPVIMVSGYASVPVTVEAMQNGALTLLEKPYDDQELIEAISLGTRINAKWLRRRALQKEIQQRVDSLTTKEKQVLDLLLKGLPNKQMSTRLNTSLRTIERRRNAILKKMQAKNVTSIVRQLTILEWHQVPQRELSGGLGPEVTSQ